MTGRLEVRKKIIVWGGFWDRRRGSLAVSELNSHASVTCFFLTQALQSEFEVVQISGFHAIEDALQHQDAVAVLSTFQAGFTRLYEDDPVTFGRLKLAFGSRLMSLIDFVSLKRYQETQLFTVLPPRNNLKQILKHRFAAKSVNWMGWCASSEYCRPVATDRFQVFVDHANYGGEDHSQTIFNALSHVCSSSSVPELDMAVQTNNGIETWSSDKNFPDFDFQRTSKVSWLEMQAAYGRSSLFVVTHRESAGLAVLEAAMAGARIIVPKKNGRPFINDALLSTGIDYIIAECDEYSLATTIARELTSGVDRTLNHKRLAATHDWAVGARRIKEVLTG